MFATYFDNRYQDYVINSSEKYDTINLDSVQFFKVYTLIKKTDNYYISYGKPYLFLSRYTGCPA